MATLALAGALTGCLVYQPEVQQGNVVTREMVEKLKPGMNKSQVRFVLGTPLIADPFHPNRWDYIYLYRKTRRSPIERTHLTIVFQGDTMLRMEGELAPKAKTPAAAAPAAQPKASSNPTPAVPAQ